MLVEYSFKNFCSFKDSATFSMKATDKNAKVRFPDNFTTGKIDTLKTAVIVGENAGGKSNFIRSLDYLKNFFQVNRPVFSTNKFINDNHINSGRVSRQIFSLKVLLDEALYTYNLSIDRFGITDESLSVKKGSKSAVKVFSVKRSKKVETPSRNVSLDYDLYINEQFEGSIRDLLKDSLSNNRSYGLFISKLALLGIEPAIAFSDWINDSLCINCPPLGSYDLQYIVDKISPDDMSVMKEEKFLDILRFIDPSIVKVILSDKDTILKTVIVRKNKNGKTFERELINDSSGLRDYFAWAVQIFKVVYQNKVIFIDEVDRSLNPILADRIISFIHGSEHCGQFIFTTHNVMHLDLNNYMREQIYFVTKDIETLNSEMYSLADFDDIGYDENDKLYELYLRGILGGTPRG